MNSRPSKRIKLSLEQDDPTSTLQGRLPGQDVADPASIRAKRAAFLTSISRSISPPGISRSGTTTPRPTSAKTVSSKANATADTQPSLKRSPITSIHETGSKAADTNLPTSGTKSASRLKLISSPFKLTTIRDLPPSKNVETVSLHDILGNPLIKEAWIFNFCFDVKVKIVHGSWKNENGNKIGIDDACRRWDNVESFTAYLPDPFGTHHSKMFILFTYDDQAQVVIHTANMLEKDWTNMTQAAWVSPMLPLLKDDASTVVGKIGSGSRFKHDLLAYLAAYGSKAKTLKDQLAQFDFSSVRGALISSVPSRMKDFPTMKNTKALWDQKLWGYPSLCRALKSILPQQQKTPSPHVVCQISSIATLPQTWLNQFFPVLCGLPSPGSTKQQFDPSRISIVYPTPTNVASSLDGYLSGGSIHTKAQSATHLKQIDGLRNSLCQWTKGPREDLRASREEAAPHIKTYVCFSAKPTKGESVQEIQWAMLTSANLSQQAWGTLRDSGKGKQKEKEIVVQSFEIGVLVWPELFAEDFDTGERGVTEPEQQADSATGEEVVRMVPAFGKDTPSSSDTGPNHVESSASVTLVGLRLPYDLPLTPYAANDMPWSPQGMYEQRDRWGRRWPGDFH